jgi:tetratricopeptide (TPR) repeat protein
MRSWPFILLLATAGLLLGGPDDKFAQAQVAVPGNATEFKPIGKVLSVSGSVVIQHTTAVVLQANLARDPNSTARIGDLVYQGDIVETRADGVVGIVFLDGTSFNLSRNARIELNELIYNPRTNSNSTFFNLQKGTLTFIAGATAKIGDMKIETPVATMGIRGTAPRVEILDDGSVKFSTLIEEYKKDQRNAPSVSGRAEVLELLERCNSRDATTAVQRIEACRSLVDTHVDKPQSLALVYNNLGTARVVNGDYASAIDDYTASIRHDPNSAKVFNNRGIAHQRNGNRAQALADFSRAISISSDYVPALANRAKLYEVMNDTDRAIADLSRAIQLQPSSGLFRSQRCWLRAIGPAPGQAIDDCNEAIRLGPVTAARLDSRGLAYLKLGNLTSSLADYNAALAIDPRLASALYGRGLAKRRSGDNAGAGADIAAAARINNGIAAEFARYGLR